MSKSNNITVISMAVLFLVLVPVIATGGNWVKVYDESVKNLVLYDIDNDGVLEIVTNSAIIDGKSTIPIQPSLVFRADFDHDGKSDLVIYTPTTGRLTIEGTKVKKVYTIDTNLTDYEIYNDGFRIGHYVFGGGTFIDVHRNDAVPLVINNKLYAVFIHSSKGLVLYDGVSYDVVFPISNVARVVGAGANNGTAYILVSTNTSSAIIRYNPLTGEADISIYNIGVEKGYFVNNGFLAIGKGGYKPIYIVTMKNLTIANYALKVFYPVEDVDMFVRYAPPYLYVMRFTGTEVMEIKKIEVSEEPLAVDYVNGTLAISLSDGIYMYSATPYPVVNIDVPAVATVNEPFAIRVNGTYNYVEVIVNGKTYKSTRSPAEFNITIGIAGDYPITIKACNEPNLCSIIEKTIRVAPRELLIKVDHPSKVDPYSQFTLTVKTYDALTNKEVKDIKCDIVLLSTNERKIVPPFTPITLNAVPIGMEVPISISCWSGVYAVTETSVTIPVSKPYMNVTLTYLGGGKFLVKAYNTVTKEPFTGTITIAVDNGKPVKYLGQGIVQVNAGEHVLHIELSKDNVVYLKTQVKINYYPNILEVPQGAEVKVADRVVTQTVTKTVNQTITVTQPKIVEVEKVNIPIVLGVLVLGLGIGIMVTILIPRRGGGK